MNIDLRRGFSRVGSQGDLGSCAAFAAASILDYVRNRTRGWYDDSQKQQYSPRYLYYFARPAAMYQRGIWLSECPIHPDHPRDIDTGTASAELKDAIMRFGVCQEEQWEYAGCSRRPFFQDYPDHSNNKFALRPTVEDRAARDNVFEFLERIDPVAVEGGEWAREVMKGNPVLIGIKTPSSWHPKRGPFFYDSVENGDTGHGIVIVGYDSRYPVPGSPGSRAEAFLIRNSWGADWRMDGCLWVSRRALENLARQVNFPPLVFRPKHRFVPFPSPEDPDPYPRPPEPHPGPGVAPRPPGPHPGPGPAPQPAPPHPGPAPQPAPQPTPRPQPAPTPAPGPAPGTTPHPGEFLYQWWLFDDKAQFELVSAEQNRWSPAHMHRSGMGVKLDGPDTHDDLSFGIRATGVNRPNPGRPEFTDIDRLISDPDNRGKWIGLGACRLAEVAQGMNPVEADGSWKWDGKEITGRSSEELWIEKTVEGSVDSHLLINFNVTMPDGDTQTVTVTVPPGENPTGIKRIDTVPGRHVIDEPELSGFVHITTPHVEVDIPAGQKIRVKFKNRPEGAVPPETAPPDEETGPGPAPQPQPAEAPASNPRIIPKKNPALPHPPHSGAKHLPEFRIGQTMSIPSGDSGSREGEGGAGEIDFLLTKDEGKAMLGWVCYIIRESDGEVMNPAEFNLRVKLSKRKKPYSYTGKGKNFGYKYNYFQTGKTESGLDRRAQITFDPYINIPPTVEPGYYRLVLEIAKWPEGWRTRRADHPDLGTLDIIDQNHIRFRVLPPEEASEE